MNVSVCTISFRHGLQSIEHIAQWATGQGFDGIELWGNHARHLKPHAHVNGEWLESYGLTVSMLSDYLPLHDERAKNHFAAKNVLQLADRWNALKVRVFAGELGSEMIRKEERLHLVNQLRDVCKMAAEKNKLILVEIHPRTLCDTVSSTLQLLSEVDHPSLRVNFDVLHAWESGANLDEAFVQLQPFVEHLHLKNVVDRGHLHVFHPENVFNASASRQGMTSLFTGQIDYHQFLSNHDFSSFHASLEWFGHHPFAVLKEDKQKLVAYQKQTLYH
ncbi:sugar phosphate isomerase/epimerase family protein [Shouchella hunanensis]|uniref:Sugar phosphate isomerase/epimerase n=1 Tax=Shouchella hunanensis TaxID=766894 RepID=A0ABY7W2K3_9BACI|nr:sugar phosphate isomerase/epimerase [Shouchella hunanensis]WDF03158.1 sugar phosphate isomerase/epimerase [Shouchella hunanensis]